MLRWEYFPNKFSDSVQSPPVPADFFVEADKLILKYIWKFKRHRIGKIIFTEKKWQGNTCPSDSYFKTYYKTTVMNVLSAIKVDI